MKTLGELYDALEQLGKLERQKRTVSYEYKGVHKRIRDEIYELRQRKLNEDEEEKSESETTLVD